MADWFADDTFWNDVFPFEFGDTVIAAGETQVERAIALTGVERGDALDLGCGPGRHAVPLAKLLNFFTSFGYFADAHDDLRVLQNVHASLRPGGILLMELVSKERMAKVLESRSALRLPPADLLGAGAEDAPRERGLSRRASARRARRTPLRRERRALDRHRHEVGREDRSSREGSAPPSGESPASRALGSA